MPSERWFRQHGARLAPLRPIYLGDDLFACHPVAKMVTDAGDDFIFTAKETSHKALYDFIAGAELSSHQEKARRRTSERDVPLSLDRGGSDPRGQGRHPRQLDRLRDRRRQGKVKYSMACRWPSLPVSKANVAEIVACGRARWKSKNRASTS